MAMDPIEFVKLASRLATGKADEPTLRTAVGRLYYGLFLIARDKTHIRGRSGVHKKTIRKLRRTSGCRATADKLQDLFDLRCVADYEPLPKDASLRNWAQNWSRANRLGSSILGRLKQLR